MKFDLRMKMASGEKWLTNPKCPSLGETATFLHKFRYWRDVMHYGGNPQSEHAFLEKLRASVQGIPELQGAVAAWDLRYQEIATQQEQGHAVSLPTGQSLWQLLLTQAETADRRKAQNSILSGRAQGTAAKGGKGDKSKGKGSKGKGDTSGPCHFCGMKGLSLIHI